MSIARVAIEYAESVVTDDVVKQAEQEWLKESLASDCSVVEQHMNSRETKAGRKNQTLYALGRCELSDFRNRDIDQIVRSNFPKSTNDVVLDIPGLMSKFSSSDNPLIRKTKEEDAYRFVAPKYRMALRAMLDRTANEKVVKVT